MNRKASKAVLCGAVAAGVATALLAGTDAAGASTPGTLHIAKQYADSYQGPLQLAVGNGKILVADSPASAIYQLGNPTPIAHGPSPEQGEVAGVDINRVTGDIAYTSTNYAQGDSSLVILHNGRSRTVDTGAYERTVNPDRNVTYGAVGKTTSCQRDALQKATGHPAVYKGVVDTHAYAVSNILHNNWAVADAAGNDILRVDSTGKISTLAVLPAQAWKITKAFAQENGLPSCVVGLTYRFESVPTDVELGPNGQLYVTTLPGGEIPNSGRLYMINIHTGAITLVAQGFNIAVNVAVTPSGDAYVSELGNGDIKFVHNGQVSTAISNLPGVAGLQYAQGALYASTAPGIFDGMTPGHVYRLEPSN